MQRPTKAAGTPRAEPLQRYSARERAVHWWIALSFILAGLSGLALFHPALFWFSNFFGGGSWTRILHPFIGVLLCLAFFPFAFALLRHNLMRAYDWDWIRQARDVMHNREERLPDVGRYNAGQKLLFWTLVTTIALLLATGIVLWQPYFAPYFAIGQIRIAAAVHAASALFAILGIIVHIYAVIWVRGSLRAMTRGTVSAAWAHQHHRRWYEEEKAAGKGADTG